MKEKFDAFVSNDVVRRILSESSRKERRRLIRENRALLESLRFVDKIVVGGKVIMK